MLGIVVLLLNRDKISARLLSERFEVSVRTIYRDIEAINMAGIPIVTYPGNRGGFGIMNNYRLDRQVLSIDDMTSIITSLKSVSNTTGDNDLETVAEKILSLVPIDKTEKIKRRFEEFSIDIMPWGFVQKSKEYIKILQQAISERNLVQFTYRNMRGEFLERVVEPMTVVFKGYAWYLFAFCRIRNDYRIFRLSRMDELKIMEEIFERRVKTYRDIASETIDESKFVNLVLKFRPEVRIKVEEYYSECNVTYLDDGSMIVRASFPEDEWVYGAILSFGSFVEVLEPPHIRDIIKEQAKKMFDIYKHDSMVSQLPVSFETSIKN